MNVRGNMKIALLQINSTWEDETANLRKAALLIREAAHAGCDVAVLPEMFSTGFTMNIPVVSDGRKTTAFLSGLARELGVSIIAGIATKKPRERRGTNNAVMIDPNGHIIARYAKIMMFPLTSEAAVYRPGKKPVIFSLGDFLASSFICYDLRFPEIFRQASRDVEIIFVIANWPDSRMNHWEALLRARAIENQCYAVGVNRLGKDGNGLQYTGGSLVVDPMGKTVMQLDWRREWAIVEIDPLMVADVRSRYPFLPK